MTNDSAPASSLPETPRFVCDEDTHYWPEIPAAQRFPEVGEPCRCGAMRWRRAMKVGCPAGTVARGGSSVSKKKRQACDMCYEPIRGQGHVVVAQVVDESAPAENWTVCTPCFGVVRFDLDNSEAIDDDD